LLKDVRLRQRDEWRDKHLRTIRHAYARRPYFNLMFELAESIYSQLTDNLAEFNINGIERIAQWLGLSPRFIRSSAMDIGGTSTERLVALSRAVSCDIYLTGHGALDYLNHQKFEDQSISVRYIDYKKVPYEQGFGEFTPYVSILDAIANCGESTRDLLCSNGIYWRDFGPQLSKG
jgi:hypothetical protein